MPNDREDLIRRLHNARESLDTELKPWHDPASEPCRAEIAKTCMALRNNNGGFMIFGIRDDGTSDPREIFDDVETTFDPETIQEIISKYSSERFEVAVHFVDRDGIARVMIEVPSGVRVPVMCRSDLPRQEIPGGHPVGSLLRKDVFYVRTFNANGRISTSPANPQDLPRLMELCFANREADIGAFMRRQLSGIDVAATSNALFDILSAAKAPTPTEAVDEFLNECWAKFVEYKREARAPEVGFREVAAIITGEFDPPDLTREYLWRIGNIPDISGWPAFVSLTSFEKHAPVYRDERGVESFIYNTEMFHILDFSRIDSAGRFYFVEGFQDDLLDDARMKIKPGEQMDFAFQTKRFADTMAKILNFAKEFCGANSECTLTVAVRWTGMKGRRLSAWDHFNRYSGSSGVANQNVFMTHFSIPVATAITAIGHQLAVSASKLFRLFGADDLELSTIEKIADDRLANRRD